MKKILFVIPITAIALAATLFFSPARAMKDSEISLDDAKRIALHNAGCKEENVTIIKSEREVENGIAQYDIGFIAEPDEYYYEIEASTGKILYYMYYDEEKRKAKDSMKTPPPEEITPDQALEIALKHAGFTAAETTGSEVKNDYDHGENIYEVEFYIYGKEYQYDIRVSDGQILDYEIDH
ncbi:PepSY domain-containing protein [Butyrivibrio sp. WCE2006]|uniref:PepSY domain-containing protein n=1 Tax=Butyrivibrio sp. WCE2006 TaxID=1410611 RepID=UPI0005D1802F|nr:PepSY domain-containing protein [Butyrivibrio sp. WCE2006]